MSTIAAYAKGCFAASDAIANFDAAMANFQRDPTQAESVRDARDHAVNALIRLEASIEELADDVLSGEPTVVPFARAR